MVQIKYDINVDNSTLEEDLKRITNQLYKLLPNREEGIDWIKPLQTLMVEVAGLDRLLVGKQYNMICLLSKMEGLFTLTKEEDFFLFRRTIFDCLNILNSLVTECHSEMN
jgi:hypothetical protein